jgi:L-asparaginase
VSKNENILILNTGGTFNKIYDQISGELIVPKSDDAVKKIILSSKIDYITIDGLIYKDSLEITIEDRNLLVNYIKKSTYEKILIIHGTDTMSKTAKYLSKFIKNKVVVLTGAMVPYNLDKVEATANLLLAIGFLQKKSKNKIYISMHGNVKKYTKIQKNRKLGIFECL